MKSSLWMNGGYVHCTRYAATIFLRGSACIGRVLARKRLRKPASLNYAVPRCTTVLDRKSDKAKARDMPQSP